MHQTTQKCTGCYDDGYSKVLNTKSSLYTVSLAVLVQQFGDLALLDIQIRLSFANPFQPELVSLFVALCARRPNRTSLLGIEHTKLQAGHVCGLAHLAAERIDFTYQMTLCQTANCWVARHLTDCIQIDGKQ